MSIARVSSKPGKKLHIICERDVGLFSLVQQVIANIPWALQERRVPIVYFQSGTCYWTPKGYGGRDTVWEYYFEPVIPGRPAASIPKNIRELIDRHPPGPFEPGYLAAEGIFVSAHFGDHPELAGKALFIPYLIEDPDQHLRSQASAIIRQFIKPRAYIEQKVDRFYSDHMSGCYVVGVHVRGTDAISKEEIRAHRLQSLRLPSYVEEIANVIEAHPETVIFVATDAQSSLDFLKLAFGSRIITYSSIRHQEGNGEAAGHGPTGWVMPAYITQNRELAALNAEEAIIEYLLLSRCQILIHNGSSLARTVLLNVPQMEHVSTHGQLAARIRGAIG